MHRVDSDKLPDIVFIHVMKTGGTSIYRALGELFPLEARYPAESTNRAVGKKVDLRDLQARIAAADPPVRFVSVHMPAWVAEAFAPNHLRVTVLREPMSRTLSHLQQEARTGTLSNDIEVIYDNPLYRRRLANYQTRVFSMTEAHQLAAEENRRVFDRRIADGSEEARAELERMFKAFMATAVSSDDELTEQDLTDAVERLDRFDVVGTTDRLDEFVRRIEARLGTELPGIGRDNVTLDDQPVSAGLLDRIRADNVLDFELYDHACRLAGADDRIV
jgi:Sulfotransferase family